MKKLIGQQKLREGMKILMGANDIMPHVLLVGEGGLGKTSFVKSIVHEQNGTLLSANGSTIKTESHILPYILKLEEGNHFFIDEIHGLNKRAQETLYTAMEDGKVDIAGGPGGDSYTYDCPNFTLIGATTDVGLLTNSFQTRFKATFYLEDYSLSEMAEIIKVHNHSKIDVDCEDLAKFCRGIPRRGVSYLGNVIAYCKHNNFNDANIDVISKALKVFGVYHNGLNRQDLTYLKFLSKLELPNTYASLDTICGATGLDKKAIEQKIEPFLLKNRLIIKSGRGRTINHKNYKLIMEKIGDI